MRPEFHFTARSGWINDPHGVTARNGGYDMFFQYVPDSVVWAPNCHWGHARGADLLSLSELPIALAPGDGDDGIWTGSIAQTPEGKTRLFYTSVRLPNIGIGTVREATPADDSWVVWNKGPRVASAPENLNVIAYRDPFVRRDGDGWNMFLGAGLADGTATALRYSSPDLDAWTYEGVALERSTSEKSPVWMGALWECPQFFEVDGVSVMISSVWDDDVLYYAGYGTGDYRDGTFTASTWGQLSFGPSYYAPSFFTDAAGRPCLMFWMRGVEDRAAGWASAHSIAYVLGIANGRLTAAFHPDLDRYVGAPLKASASVRGLAALVMFDLDSADSSLTVYSGGSEVLRVARKGDHVLIRRGEDSWSMPHATGEIRLLLDGPVAELTNGTAVFGVAIEPTGDALDVATQSASAVVSPVTRT
jgi:beta-fructofuranosidase